MSTKPSFSLAAAVLGAGMLPQLACAQSGAELAAGTADHAAAVGPAPSAQVNRRSDLWQAVEAERRRAEQAGENNPRRLSEAQRQELRDQIRRASMRTDNPPMSAVVSRP